MDFITKEPVDIIISRKENYTKDYFSSISLHKRLNVKFFICYMYKPYIKIRDRYFPNALLVVDSFHVISHLNRELSKYLFKLKMYYQNIDKIRLIEINEKNNNAYESIQASLEVYLLQKYSWIFLKNESKLNLDKKIKYNSWFCGKWSINKVREEFFKLDSSLIDMYRLRERYVNFNSNTYGSLNEVEDELKTIIKEDRLSKLPLFKEFANTLSRNFSYIVNSFINYYSKVSNRSLSNGPIEGFNRRIKDLKRNSRGVSNFEFIRARILWSTRKSCPFKG